MKRWAISVKDAKFTGGLQFRRLVRGESRVYGMITVQGLGFRVRALSSTLGAAPYTSTSTPRERRFWTTTNTCWPSLKP